MADITDKALLPFPELTDSPNVPDDINNLAVALDSIVVPKYANAAARDAANPSPTSGDRCYQTDIQCALIYRSASSSWRLEHETLLNEHTFTGSTSTVTISAIPGIGSHLRVVLSLRSQRAVHNAEAHFQVNGITSGNYNFSYFDRDQSSANITDGFVSAGTNVNGIMVPGNNYHSAARCNAEILFSNYSSANAIMWRGGSVATDGGTVINTRDFGGGLSPAGATGPLTSFAITETTGANFSNGSKIWIYALP